MTESKPALPVVIIDSREQAPLPIRRLPTVVAGLQTGDYSSQGFEEAFAIERKSVQDLVACCVGENRLRFERELHRLCGFRFKRLLIVGVRAEIEQHRYRSNIAPASILASIATWEIRHNVPVVWEPDPEFAARRIEVWAWYFMREVRKAVQAVSAFDPQAFKPFAPEHQPVVDP